MDKLLFYLLAKRSADDEIAKIQDDIASAYTACEGKGATLPQTQDSANLPDTIESIPTGGSAVVTEQALNLYDWEGTLLKSYTAAEAQTLAALPAPADCPVYEDVDHELLLFQEWNWSLTNIKTWLTNHAQGKLNVGAIYTTADGQDHNYWASPRGEGAARISMQKKGTDSIGYNAFYNYCSLTSINIPDSVASIEGYAFSNCRSLTSINIPDSVVSIGNFAFYNCYSLMSINIPDSITSIGGSTFENCFSLSSINIPDSVVSIGGYAFINCESLMSINIPDSVTSIKEHTFENCYSLPSINIPDSVTTIGAGAFSSCKNLFDILLESKPILSNTNAFSDTPSTQKIYVPRANLSWFETATNWSTMYSKFVAIEDNIAYLESLGYNVDAYKGGAA